MKGEKQKKRMEEFMERTQQCRRGNKVEKKHTANKGKHRQRVAQRKMLEGKRKKRSDHKIFMEKISKAKKKSILEGVPNI